jgi:hypothetical protein
LRPGALKAVAKVLGQGLFIKSTANSNFLQFMDEFVDEFIDAQNL